MSRNDQFTAQIDELPHIERLHNDTIIIAGPSAKVRQELLIRCDGWMREKSRGNGRKAPQTWQTALSFVVNGGVMRLMDSVTTDYTG